MRCPSLQFLRDNFYVSSSGVLWRIYPDKACTSTYTDKQGYLVVTINYRRYFQHRIVFLMTHGYLPASIDHVDRDKANNRVSNLRPATQRQQAGNCKSPSVNTSGYKGVTRHKNGWQVTCGDEYIGLFRDIKVAANAYDVAALNHYGEFACLNLAYADGVQLMVAP